MIDEKALKDAFHAMLAKQVLDGLDTEYRDQLIVKAVAHAMGDFPMKTAIGQAITAKAAEVAGRLLATPEWEAAIEGVMMAGFLDYLHQLRAATADMLKRAFHGTDGQYRSAADILMKWPKIEYVSHGGPDPIENVINELRNQAAKIHAAKDAKGDSQPV